MDAWFHRNVNKPLGHGGPVTAYRQTAPAGAKLPVFTLLIGAAMAMGTARSRGDEDALGKLKPEGTFIANAAAKSPQNLEGTGHPIDPALALMHRCRQKYAGVTDYTATFVKQELIGRELTPNHYIAAKFRA